MASVIERMNARRANPSGFGSYADGLAALAARDNSTLGVTPVSIPGVTVESSREGPKKIESAFSRYVGGLMGNTPTVGYDPSSNKIKYFDENGALNETGDLTGTGITKDTDLTGLDTTRKDISLSDLTKDMGLTGDNLKDTLGGAFESAGTIGKFITGQAQNRLARDNINAHNAESARLRQKDEAFSAAINASGLGTRA